MMRRGRELLLCCVEMGGVAVKLLMESARMEGENSIEKESLCCLVLCLE